MNKPEKCKWWHSFFITFEGETKQTTRGNYVGAKQRIDFWFKEYKCNICKETYKVNLKDTKEE